MGRMFRKPGGDGPREPRFDSAPMLDQVDWAHRILYGDLHMRLAAIYEAKGRKRVEALPALLMAGVKDGEAALEAREAATAIIADNPAHKDILGLVPELAKKLPDPRALWVLSAIAEANPRSEECRKAVPALIRALTEQRGGEDEPLRDALFALGKIGDASAAPAIKKLIESGRAIEGSDLWNTAMGALRKIEPQ
jgi:hypothetical protein